MNNNTTNNQHIFKGGNSDGKKMKEKRGEKV